MTNHLHRLVLASGILLLGVLATTSQASYIDFDGPRPDGTVGRIAIESFENATFPAQPTGDHYTRTVTGTGNSAIDVSQEDTGAQSYLIDGSSTSDDLIVTFTTTTPNICLAGGMRFAIRANEDLNTWAVSLKSASKEAEMRVNMGANTFSFSNGATTSSTNSIGLLSTASTAWQHLGITCDGDAAVTFVNYDLGSSQLLTGSGSFAPTKIVFTSDTGGTGTGPAIHIDSLQWGVPVPGIIFCANPFAPDFEYNFNRNSVAYIENNADGAGGSLNDAFVFEGDENVGEWSALAKQFLPGTTAAFVEFRLVALADGDSSVFRAAFMKTVGANVNEAAFGNGLTTGNFAQHVEVELTEDGERWQGRFYYTDPQIASGARTQLGSTFQINQDPNDPITLRFYYDSRATAQGPDVPDGWEFSGGGTIQQGPYLALTTPDFPELLTDSSNQLILKYASFKTTTPGGGTTVATEFTEQEIFDQWFIGYGTSGTLTDAQTALDDMEDDHNSTCIYDLTGIANVVGGSGLSPIIDLGGDDDEEAGPCASFLCVDSSTVPEGFTAGTFNLFLGLLLMISIGVGVFLWTKSAAMGTGGFAGGFLIAFSFGLIPLWVIVAVVIVAVAVIFVRVKGSLGGG